MGRGTKETSREFKRAGFNTPKVHVTNPRSAQTSHHSKHVIPHVDNGVSTQTSCPPTSTAWLRQAAVEESTQIVLISDPFGAAEDEPLQTRGCFILKTFGMFYCLGA